METQRSSKKPEFVTRMRNKFHQNYFIVTFNVRQNPETKEWLYNEVTILPGHNTYEGIVDTIVQAEYPVPNMQAIQNNYLRTNRTQEHEADMETMQNWRDMAKDVARDAMEIIGE